MWWGVFTGSERCNRRCFPGESDGQQYRVRRLLNDVFISPSKLRSVQRETAKVHEDVLLPFTDGERVDSTEGKSLTSTCWRIYLKTLAEEHNRGGKHLELHSSVRLGYTFKRNVTLPTSPAHSSCFIRRMLLILDCHCSSGSIQLAVFRGWHFFLSMRWPEFSIKALK